MKPESPSARIRPDPGLSARRSGAAAQDAATDTIRSNKAKYIAASALYSTALLCMNGTLMQTFLGEIGLTDRIYLHATLLQIMSVAGTMAFSHAADGPGSLLRRMALTNLPILALYLVYIPLCVFPVPDGTAFLAAAVIGVVQSLFVSIHTVYDYKIPYRIIPLREYGPMSAASGIATGLASMGVGALMTYLSQRFAYRALMCWAFPAAALITALSAGITFTMRPLSSPPVPSGTKKNSVSFARLLQRPVFTVLLIPNLLRGIATGITGILAAVALQQGFSVSMTTAMVTVSSAAWLAACLLFAVLVKRIVPRLLVFAGSLLMLPMPLLAMVGEAAYLPLYGLIIAGRTFIDYSVPAALILVVPDEIAGPFNAWRMALHMGGGILGTFLAGFLPPAVLLASAAALQLISGAVYLTSPVLRTRSAG